MPLNFNKPVVSGNYNTDVLQPIVDAQKALAQWLDPAVVGALTGTPTGAKRLNAGVLEQFNGTSWAGVTLKATSLITARKINGVNFDGTADITVADATKAPLNGVGAFGTWNISITGSVNGTTGTFSGLVKGNGGGVGLGKITVLSGTGTPSGTSVGDLVLRY